MLEFLSKRIKDGLSYLNMQYLYEIRLRVGQPIFVNYKGDYRYLSEYGLTNIKEKAMRCRLEEIEECVFCAGNYAVYSVEEQIKRGFITAKNGERIGLAGEYVFEKGQPLSLRNFSSVCIRIPHEIVGCAREIYDSCMSDKVSSVLLCAPPGLGKTTILRDLSRMICEKTQKNVLICDERGEISAMNFGETCDVLKFSDKATAFEAGIRAMRPDVIVTDELFSGDVKAVEQAVYSGVKVLASTHYTKLERLQEVFRGLFDFFVILDNDNVGKISKIYNENGVVVV